MIITSIDNANIVRLKKLADKKYRKEYGQFVIEGARLVADAIEHGASVENIFLRESNANEYNYENAIVVADKVFDKICDTVNSQGILAIVNIVESSAMPSGCCLILDGLQDPGNVGTLIRTAASCGFTDVYLANCVDAYSPKVVRSAMSAHFCVNLHTTTLDNAFEQTKHCQQICADMNGENAFECHFDSNIALVLGNEGNGLSAYSREHVKNIVSLPMTNNFESLNVAVAGSVLMYLIKFGK